MKTLSIQILEAKERTYKEVLAGFYKLGYANYGFIHFYKGRRGVDIKLDYPDEDKKYSSKEILYCPQDRYFKYGETPIYYKIDTALSTGDNEKYLKFSADYGVFWSEQHKYFYFVKLTENNLKYLDKYVKSRLSLKEQKAKADKRQQEEEERKAKWAEQAAKRKAKLEANQKYIDEFNEKVAQAKKEAEKFEEEWKKNPEAFPKMPEDVYSKYRLERNQGKKKLEDTNGYIKTLEPEDLYPYIDILTYRDPYYDHDQYIRLLKYDGKKYSYDFTTYSPGRYWGD